MKHEETIGVVASNVLKQVRKERAKEHQKVLIAWNKSIKEHEKEHLKITSFKNKVSPTGRNDKNGNLVITIHPVRRSDNRKYNK